MDQMNNESDKIPCTWADDSDCIDCSLNESLNCRYDDSLVVCFRERHIPYRALGFAVVFVASYLSGQWWMFIAFTIVTLMNFLFLETWYLCRHCPFYAKEGKTLDCITLKGMPRPWKYNSTPMTRSDKIIMGTIGGFIDAFPIIAGGIGILMLILLGADIMQLLILLALTVVMLIAAGYLGKFIGNNYCMKCVNLSCPMNKVPPDIAEAYLQRNPTMKYAFENANS